MILIEGENRDIPRGARQGPGRAVGRQGAQVGDAGIAPLPLEHIAEPPQHRGRGGRVGIGGDAGALADEERADIVDAVGLVRMVVGQQHGVQPLHPGFGGLHAQIG